MKPISSLNALVSSIQLPPSSAVALKSSFPSDTDSNSGEKSLGITLNPKSLNNQQMEQSNSPSSNTTEPPSPPASSSSNKTSSTKLSYKPSSNKMEKKSIIGGQESTQLGIVEHTSPLSMFMNNKVGSSFRNQEQALMNYQQHLQANMLTLPVTSRKVRDYTSLLLMLAFLGFLVYIIWDGLIVKEADINLIVHGHDSYGNICGRNNRPIKFVEKSGKNYNDKQYTKYTLINAQFERYTLDSDRLKQGELYYIKQGGEYRLPPASIQDGQEHAREPNTIAQTKKRSKRSMPKGELFEHHEQLYKARNNQTLLNKLKSSLMYQYPPMYEYSNRVIAQSDGVVEHKGLQYLVQHRDNDTSKPEILTDLSTSQSELTYYRAIHPKSVSSVALAAKSSTLAPTLSNLLTRRSEVFDAATTPLAILYDDQPNNDSDRYEHMLIKPISTNLYRPKTTNFHEGGLDLNEVSSQLLYLTECVDQCPADHVELIFYRCMPRNWRFSLFPNAINVTRTFIDEFVTDVSHCYRELIYIFSFALVLSLALLILLRFLASVIIWSCLLLLISLFLSMAGYSWYNYYNQILELNNAMPHDSIYSERLASSDKWLIGAIFLTFIAFASIGTVIFMRKRILLVTMLFRESGKAIADMPLLLLQPLLTFAALVAIILTFSIGLICLQSMKIPVIDMNTGFVVFKAETLYKLMRWYHIFAFLWVSHFAIACQHYVIGASVSKWYFSTNRYNLHSPIGASVSELVLYYLGSVALGSFLVAIFKVIRFITRQIQFLVQRNCLSASGDGQSGSQSSTSNNLNSQQMSPSCCGSFSYVWRLFIWFFDNIVMIINRDAYVEIAIYGDSFLAGAQRAFTVLASNPLRLLAIKSVSNVLLVVAKICVVFGTISMATILLEEKTNQLNYSWSPIVISAVYAYIVAHWFLSVYEMVIDALFICYCEDFERSKERDMSIQIAGSNFMSHILNNGQIY